MILTCNYEELTALGHGARTYLEEESVGDRAVKAPSTTRAAVEHLLDRLTANLSLRTLAEQMEAERALFAIVEHLRAEVDSWVLAADPAAEECVGAYFEFAHALSVLGRVRDIGEEMTALIEVMTGAPPDGAAIEGFVFPD